MKTKNILIKIVSIIFLAVLTSAYAEDKEKNDGLAQVIMVTAKQGQSEALEEGITKYHKYMSDKKGAWRYQIFRIETGKNTGKYIARSGGHNWADFDATYDWEKKAGKKFKKLIAPHVESAVTSITKTDDEVGMWPENMDGYQYFLLTRWNIRPGMNKEFSDGLKKVDAILKEHKWPNHYAFVDTVSGGYGNFVTLVSPKKSYADMAPKGVKFIDYMNKGMSEEESGAFLKKWGATYKTGEYYMIKYLSEVSKY